MTPGRALDLSGTWRAAAAVGDLHQRFVETGFDDRDWAPLPVPGHWRSTPDFAATDGPVLYRRRFELPAATAPGTRRFLVLDGVFYYGDVWLDAGYLAATEGYFFPRALEVTDALRAGDEHVVAIEVACPRQTDRTAKRLVTGVFSHWDNLDPTWNPGGLWRPVRVIETGPVRLARLSCVCVEATEERGRLRLDITLDPTEDPDPAPLPVRLTARATGPLPSAALLVEATRDVSLAGGDNHLSWTLDVDQPPRWWPWRLGEPSHQVDLEVVVEVDGAPSDVRRLRTAFREVRMRRWQLTVNGERMYAMGSNQGPTRMALAEATPEELARDVRLAVDANLDLLRIHAHVTRPELYDAADAAGLLLWQDFPLQWGYARGLRRQAAHQAREMVDLLGHHPSIALWCAHNEPLALDVQPGEPVRGRTLARLAGSMFLPTWNKDVLDRSVARALHRADPSRPVDLHSGVLPGPASGGTDTHFYFGWYHGRMDGLAPALRAVPRLARFVTEFGAQAVPDSASFMDPERWPDLDWETLFERHALQARVFERYVPPGEHATFDEWRAATQAYQAALIQLQIEDLRRLKYDPNGGFCHFCFADGHPAVTWSVLDHERVPKAGFDALRDACRPVLAMVEPREGLVHVVSELRHGLSDAVIEVHANGSQLGKWTGYVPGDGIAYVSDVELDGTHDLVAALSHPEIGRVENRYSPLILQAVRRSGAARPG
ncbi:MAG: glycoside hydrolase family 2 protein [Acidimicrobiia bacterium]